MDNENGSGNDEEGPPRENILNQESEADPDDPELDSFAEVEFQCARDHFSRYLSLCRCPSWNGKGGCVADRLELSISFARLDQNARVNAVRAMLLPLVATPGESNELAEWDAGRAQTRKLKRRRGIEERPTMKYVIKGRRVCLSGFAAVTQFNEKTIQRLARRVSIEPDFKFPKTQRALSRAGKQSLQTVAVLGFLRRYSELNGMLCPNGRGSSEDHPVCYLPSDTDIAAIYSQYTSMWADISNCLVVTSARKWSKPDEPLVLKSFLRVWRTTTNCKTWF